MMMMMIYRVLFLYIYMFYVDTQGWDTSKMSYQGCLNLVIIISQIDFNIFHVCWQSNKNRSYVEI